LLPAYYNYVGNGEVFKNGRGGISFLRFSSTAAQHRGDCIVRKVFFRRVTLSASEAFSWYRSLDEENSKTPLPSLKEHQIIKRDDISFDTPDLVDDPLWPTLGLPLNGEWLSRDIFNPIKTCPFLGTVVYLLRTPFPMNVIRNQ